MNQLSFAERVKRFRKKHGLSQDGFSKKYGIPIHTVQSWEQGRRAKSDKPSYLIAFFILIERETEIMDALLIKHSLLGNSN